MSEVLRSFFSYQVAVGRTMSEYTQVVDMRKSSVTSRSSFPSGASSCQTTSLGFFLPSSPRSLPMHAVLGAEQVLEEILVALARRAEQVRAPDEQVARPVVRIVGIVAGQLQLARLQRWRRRNPWPPGRRRRRLSTTCSGLVSSCGADGSQPMRSARTL